MYHNQLVLFDIPLLWFSRDFLMSQDPTSSQIWGFIWFGCLFVAKQICGVPKIVLLYEIQHPSSNLLSFYCVSMRFSFVVFYTPSTFIIIYFLFFFSRCTRRSASVCDPGEPAAPAGHTGCGSGNVLLVPITSQAHAQPRMGKQHQEAQNKSRRAGLQRRLRHHDGWRSIRHQLNARQQPEPQHRAAANRVGPVGMYV